jgi:hypothetical protein
VAIEILLTLFSKGGMIFMPGIRHVPTLDSPHLSRKREHLFTSLASMDLALLSNTFLEKGPIQRAQTLSVTYSSTVPSTKAM